ncbi:DUF262 domain-containing protein [Salinibacterium sp. SWN248]|uniref:DUF262 domain-containing protein n=1 Tax=Salinibacterium sp. SWN248 TaxID=2792056 RepID=UPI0018CF4E6A|nr:DUF262 domain-containing protein [Salinibacterium sp. SWN248]MBH0023189.1 DUF262 domain-containing protein [Salinibacterium sp. SWN248]
MAEVRGLEAAPVSLGDRLKDDVQLYCPLFQRRYVWGRAQIDMLWEDIDTILDEQYKGRFLGALVFDDERPSTAGEAGLYWIIDGQQRMTTMVLTIVALAAHARRFGDAGKDIASDLFEQYVVSRKRATKNQPKLRPTLKDTRQFNDILRSAFGDGFDLDIDVEREAGESSGDLAKAYKLLLGHVEKRTSESETGTPLTEDQVVARIGRLRDVLLDNLEFVEIRLGDAHDPNEVFDRLNNEGVKLGIIDLVRNEVLKRLRDDAKLALKLYSEEWKPFEDAFADDAAKTGYFFPFALTIDPQVTKSSTFKALARRWSEDAADTNDPKQQMLAIMRDLRRYQSSYNAIHSAKLDGLEPELVIAVRRLNDLNRPSSCYPYIIQLLTATGSGDIDTFAAVKCLEIIESFLVRRALLGIEPTGLHAIFKRLWVDAGGDPALVRKEIVSNTVVFPANDRVKEAIESGDLYHRRICAYVLTEYERVHTSGDVLESFPSVTVDHVMPQSHSGDWTLSFTPDEHNALLNTWANLVPLSNAANAGKGSGNWADARARLSNETVFATTKHIYDDYEEWTPKTIAHRSLELQAWAIDRWPYFGPESPELELEDGWVDSTKP